MDVTFALAAPSGCSHYKLTVTRVSDGRSRVLHVHRSDLALDMENADDAVLAVVRHLVKTAGATTLAQARTALEGKVVKL